MDLLKELTKLTKQELITLVIKRHYPSLRKHELLTIRIDTLSRQWEKDSEKALAEMGKWNGKDNLKWLLAHKEYEKTEKLYKKIEKLHSEMKI